MLYNQNKSCVKSCQNIALKTHCFPKKRIVFQHVHFFIPLFWNEKLSLQTIKNIASYGLHRTDSWLKSTNIPYAYFIFSGHGMRLVGCCDNSLSPDCGWSNIIHTFF